MNLRIKIDNVEDAEEEINTHSARAVAQILVPVIILREGIRLMIDEEGLANKRFNTIFGNEDSAGWKEFLSNWGRTFPGYGDDTHVSESTVGNLFHRIMQAPLQQDELEVVSIMHGCIEYDIKEDLKGAAEKIRDVIKRIGDWFGRNETPQVNPQNLTLEVRAEFADSLVEATDIQYAGFGLIKLAVYELVKIFKIQRVESIAIYAMIEATNE